MDKFNELYGKKHILELWCIGQEKHKDGNFHLHAYVRFKKPVRTQDPGYFDITENGVKYHPNIKTIRTAKSWVKYCEKYDEEPLKNFDSNQSYKKIMEEYMEYGAEEFKQETPTQVCTIFKA